MSDSEWVSEIDNFRKPLPQRWLSAKTRLRLFVWLTGKLHMGAAVDWEWVRYMQEFPRDNR